MIRVESIEDIPQPARDRIKAKVMRRFLRHLADRPEISDDTLRLALGFDRATLATLAQTLGMRGGLPEGEPPAPLHGAALGAAQAPMQASLAHPANQDAPPAARAGGCCGGKTRD